MTKEAYNQYFEQILANENPGAPYDDPHFLDYTKMNQKRSARWFKHGEILPELQEVIERIDTPHHWILITEPWCGDAAHSVPFIQMISDLNPLIQLEIQLRDTDSEIENYLTNGGKSIPILVLRNGEGEDLAVWGPRPAGCQMVFQQLKDENADFETLKVGLQNWYNHNKGVEIQEELTAILSKIS
jgi:hypothetical protein